MSDVTLSHYCYDVIIALQLVYMDSMDTVGEGVRAAARILEVKKDFTSFFEGAMTWLSTF